MRTHKTFLQILIELSLIIVGVLAALGVENWRGSIAEHKTERECILNLKEALQIDTALIRAEIKLDFDKGHAASKILEMMESGIAASPEEFENIIVNIIRVVNPTCNPKCLELLERINKELESE